MKPVSPTRWRALPTALLVIVAIALGAVTARADDGAPRSVSDGTFAKQTPNAELARHVTPAAVR